MANTVVCTVTGKIGPGLTATSQSFVGVTSIVYNIVGGTLEIVYGAGKRAFFDYNQTTTVTMTISGTVTTVTIS